VDHGVEPTELVDAVCDTLRTSYGGEVAQNDILGARRRRKCVAAALVISPMQDDVMALLDQKPGRHQSEAVRRSRDENASHQLLSFVEPSGWPDRRDLRVGRLGDNLGSVNWGFTK
jgi:hypothetical protein